jgi:CheY-like chemotaxis protein
MRGEINWHNKSILIVEDDHINFSYLDILLKPTRVKIFRAEEGQSAIDIIFKNPDIDLVLMDIRLPGLNGLDATRRIVAFRESLPIIAQTAYAEQEDQRAAFEAGCCDFIAKPIRANEMLDLIRKHLGHGS